MGVCQCWNHSESDAGRCSSFMLACVNSCRPTVFVRRLDGKHVVFGSVVEGMNVVKEMERQGSQSGKTKAKVAIADCGQL